MVKTLLNITDFIFGTVVFVCVIQGISRLTEYEMGLGIIASLYFVFRHIKK